MHDCGFLIWVDKNDHYQKIFFVIMYLGDTLALIIVRVLVQ